MVRPHKCESLWRVLGIKKTALHFTGFNGWAVREVFVLLCFDVNPGQTAKYKVDILYI